MVAVKACSKHASWIASQHASFLKKNTAPETRSRVPQPPPESHMTRGSLRSAFRIFSSSTIRSHEPKMLREATRLCALLLVHASAVISLPSLCEQLGRARWITTPGMAFCAVGGMGVEVPKRADAVMSSRGKRVQNALLQVVPVHRYVHVSLSQRRQCALHLRASTSSGLPPDPNLDEATLQAAMQAADEAEAAASGATVSAAAEAAAAYAARFPQRLPADSQFRGAEGTDTLGMMDNAEADEMRADSGAPGQINRVVLAICRATRLTPGPALPAIDNIFEYLVVLQDREGEEWVMGSMWDLPQVHR